MTADAPFTEFQQFIAIASLFAVATTVILAPILVMLYRRRVERLMREDLSGGTPSEPSAAAPPPDTPVPARVLHARELVAETSRRSSVAVTARSRLIRVALAYAAAGLAHALVLTLMYGVKYEDLVSPRIGWIIFAVFSLATVATVLHILAASGRLQAGLFAAIVLGLYLLSGTARGLAKTVFMVNVLVPALIFMVFNFRYWRGIAPLAFILCACGAIGWILAFQLVHEPLAPPTPELWVARLTGAAVGIGLGYLALRSLASLYARKWFSDQEFFIDIWWLIYTLIQTMFLILTTGAEYTGALIAFPIFLGVKRLLLRALRPRSDDTRPPRLLVLRVFGHDRRTEAFFDRLARTWRCFGPVLLIAGRDLALRTIGPVDLVAFLSGRLARHYVADGRSRARAIASLDERPDPDGRFRINPFFCREHMWRETFRDLAQWCDAVVMDMRGFAKNRVGAHYELQELACQHGAKPVLLIVDQTTELAALSNLIAIEGGVAGPHDANWTLLHAEKESSRTADSASLALLAKVVPSSVL
jgi:hypothetical protein